MPKRVAPLRKVRSRAHWSYFVQTGDRETTHRGGYEILECGHSYEPLGNDDTRPAKRRCELCLKTEVRRA